MSKSFLFLWSGQLISLFGSQLTGFGVSLFVYAQTESPFLMACAIFCKILPSIYLSLFAGPLLDRWDLRKAFLVCDSLLLMTTLALLAATLNGELSLALLLPLLFVSGAVESLQSLAFQKSVAHFQRPEFYLKSQGIVSLVENSPMLFAPAVAAVAFEAVGFQGILWLDVASFLVALGVAIAIRFPASPSPPRKPKQFNHGIKWILRHPQLRKLQLFFSLSNFANGLAGGLLAAFVLARFGGQPESWGSAGTAMAIGSTLGALYLLQFAPRASLTTWMTLGTVAAALSGRLVMATSSSLWIVCAALGIRAFLIPLISGANQTIWLRFVAKDEMGSIFGARRVLGQGAYPLAVGLGALIAKSSFIAANPVHGLSLFMVMAGTAEMVIGGFGFLAFKKNGLI